METEKKEETKDIILVVTSEKTDADLVRICKELHRKGNSIIYSDNSRESVRLFRTHPNIVSVLVQWDLEAVAGASKKEHTRHSHAMSVIKSCRTINQLVPIFILTDHQSINTISVQVLSISNGFIWMNEDTPASIAGRVCKSKERYIKLLMPPFFTALKKYTEEYDFRWHTPGHMGGVAFLKSPSGRLFMDFLGEMPFLADSSVSVHELGSLMEHSGPVGAAERQAATTFKADSTFFVTNGTSTANKMVGHATLCPGDIVLVDRNCHKSICHNLQMIGAIPVYFIPQRNAYGIIGGISSDQMNPRLLKERIKKCPLLTKEQRENEELLVPKLAIITNSTYDGLIYDVDKIVSELSPFVDAIHFDEAWYSYAAFHSLYEGRYAMSVQKDPAKGEKDIPTMFATQSTHKLLAAFSQASMVHIKRGKRPMSDAQFNESFMAHTSTSPQYTIIASLDVCTRMMNVNGSVLITEAILEAIVFRQKVEHIAHESIVNKTWWFRVWQPDRVKMSVSGLNLSMEAVTFMPEEELKSVSSSPNPSTVSLEHGDKDSGSSSASIEKDDSFHVSFYKASKRMLMSSQKAWRLYGGGPDTWHGYQKDNGFMMLDPIKVSLLTPGVKMNLDMTEFGIPAPIVSTFLESIGITKGQSSVLISSLFEFKKLFDQKTDLGDVIPSLVEQYPHRYADKYTLPSFCHEMHDYLRKVDVCRVTANVFGQTEGDLPVQVMTPAQAYHSFVRGNVIDVKLGECMGKIAAVLICPYPPGIPIVMPGERIDAKVIHYLEILENFDNLFPGFESEVHGVKVVRSTESGRLQYFIPVLK